MYLINGVLIVLLFFFVFCGCVTYIEWCICMFRTQPSIKIPEPHQEYPDWYYDSLYEPQPIEVTFDHKTFLVYDRETELWHLEERHSDPVEVEDDYTRYMRRLRRNEELILKQLEEIDQIPDDLDLDYEEIPIIGRRSPIRVYKGGFSLKSPSNF